MNDQNDLATRAKEEAAGMAKQGLAHPSTKPVLTGRGCGRRAPPGRFASARPCGRRRLRVLAADQALT